MHADLMLLYLLYLSLDDFHEEVQAGKNYCQSHYHLLAGAILV